MILRLVTINRPENMKTCLNGLIRIGENLLDLTSLLRNFSIFLKKGKSIAKKGLLFPAIFQKIYYDHFFTVLENCKNE